MGIRIHTHTQERGLVHSSFTCYYSFLASSKFQPPQAFKSSIGLPAQSFSILFLDLAPDLRVSSFKFLCEDESTVRRIGLFAINWLPTPFQSPVTAISRTFCVIHEVQTSRELPVYSLSTEYYALQFCRRKTSNRASDVAPNSRASNFPREK
jgi:hypothetical protein